jgi:hypothetical protein
MSALPVLFLLMDGVMKLLKPEFVVKATVQLGYPESIILGLGIVLLVCVILYVIPRTAVLGAILLTGYLGGRRRSAHLAHSLPALLCDSALGRTLLARRPAARAHSIAKIAGTV